MCSITVSIVSLLTFLETKLVKHFLFFLFFCRFKSLKSQDESSLLGFNLRLHLRISGRPWRQHQHLPRRWVSTFCKPCSSGKTEESQLRGWNVIWLKKLKKLNIAKGGLHLLAVECCIKDNVSQYLCIPSDYECV